VVNLYSEKTQVSLLERAFEIEVSVEEEAHVGSASLYAVGEASRVVPQHLKLPR